MEAIQTSRLMDEVLDFLASMPDEEEVLAFQPSEEMIERSRYLLERNRNRQLTPQEEEELDEFARINHMMIMWKARLRQKVLDK
jgi:uncharacterized membrane protein